MADAKTKKEFKAVVGVKNNPTVAKIINKKDGSGAFIVFADNVDILIDGKKFEMTEGRFANMEKPLDKLNYRIEQGYVKEDQIASITEIVTNSPVRYEIDLARRK